MKIELKIIVELDEHLINTNDDEEKMWLENEILVGDGNLTLHSNDIGDTIGVVKRVESIHYIN